MVPPRSPAALRRSSALPRSHSVIRPTTACSQGPNSVDEAPLRPTRFRAASITAICMPKQMPKNGTLRSRAKRTASSLPAVPRSPKPPGTRMPWTPSRRATASSSRSKTSEVDPVQLDPDIVGDAAMGQRLGQRLIAVEQVGVLADDGDGDLALGLLQGMDDALPAAHVGLAIGREAEMPQHFLVQALGMVLQRHGVDRAGVERRDHAFRAHVAEQRDLAPLVLRDRPVAAAEQDLRLDAQAEQFLDRMLGRLGLQLTGRADIGHQGQVDEEAALRPHLVRQLAQRLEEGQQLDVADGAADLDQDEV